MKIIKNRHAMSLIEIIIALAILGIITVLFLSSFTGAFSTILGTGRKTEAMTKAQTIMDNMYQSGDIATTATTHGASVINLADPFPAIDNSGGNIRYKVIAKTIDGINFNQVSIQVFYQNGKSFVTLTALIP